MSVLLNVTEGWTERLGPFTLLADGIAIDLTSLTVEVVLRRPNGTLITPTGAVTLGIDDGQVYYTPLETDFVWVAAGPARQAYKLHWRVTDSADKVVYFPNGNADEISVYRA